MNGNDFLFYLTFGVNAGAIAYAAASAVNFEIEKRIRWLKADYRREFGMQPPEYLLKRELVAQIHARRDMKR